MAGTRQYRRNSDGRFAGGGGGTVTTTGRAGGFASAAHRANVANKRATTARRKALTKKGVQIAGATLIIAGAARAGRKGGAPLGKTLVKGAKNVAAGRI